MPDQVTELFNVDVETVGLVKRGANKKPWFLMKSDEEDRNMEDIQEQLQVLEELEQEEKVTHESWKKFVGVMKDLFTPAEVKPKPEPKPEPEIDLDAVEKAHKEEIEKAQEELVKAQEQLEEAKKEAQEALEKAAEMAEAKRKVELEPIAKDNAIEVELLYRLEKADKEVFDAVVQVFQAKESQIEEGKFFEEKGSSQPGESDPAEKILKKAAELQENDSEMSPDKAIVEAVRELGGYEAYREQSLSGGK